MPSFSIEAEGEANPLTAQDIFRVLSSASGSSASQQSLQVATQQLGNWEKTPGYYSLLQDAYGDFSLPEQIRFLAIIQLKNGIDKYWRKASTNTIAKSEKEKIRSQAIDIGIQESTKTLALQNGLMLAKIVRYDFPHDWPNIISVLITHLRVAVDLESNSVRIQNILIITLQVIKELASGKLQRTKKSLESIAPELLNALGQLYDSLFRRWSSSTSSDLHDLVNSHSALKTLRRLVIAGFEHPHREPLVKQFWDLLQQHYEKIWALWQQLKEAKHDLQSQMLVKHLFQYVKLYLNMAKFHAASFVSLGCMDILGRSWAVISGEDAKKALSGTLDWTVQRHGDAVDENSPIEKLALKALLLFRACIKMVFNPIQSFKYQHPQDKLDKKAAIDEIRSTVFTDEFVVRLMETLVTQYFVLRPQDMRDWEEDPDEWEKREEEIADAWEFSIRSCSERLFLDLVIYFKELLVPRLLQVFRQHITLENQDILLKDSLYSAMGIASACIADVFDFNEIIKTTLISEVQISRPHYNLLRRRIAILLGQWVPIQPETLNRRLIYQIYAFLLSRDDKLNDHVVRVTAGRQLRLVLEPFEFEFMDFEPYATSILSNTMSLIGETQLSETKMALLETIRVAVTKLEGRIEPYAEGIMSILPRLWTESGEEHLMKQAILTMITAIVVSLGQNSVSYHGPILSLIHDSVQVESEAFVYLLEEAMELWTAILQQTPTSDPPPSTALLTLLQDTLPLLEMGPEHHRQCFEIIESYTLLSPTAVLDSTFLTPLLRSMKDLLRMLSSTRARNATIAPRVLENLISTIAAPQSFGDVARGQAIQHVVATMIDTGYVAELLQILKEAHDYHQDPRPNRQPPDVIGIGETSLFTLCSRIILLAPSIFHQALTATGSSLDWFVEEWLGAFDSIGDTIRKKLQVLGITNLLVVTSPPPQIMLKSLQSLMSLWTEIVVELSEGAADDNEGDYLWSGGSAPLPDWPGEPPEDARKRVVSNNDPTYTINIRSFIAEHLNQLIDQVGGSHAFEQEYLSQIDSVVVKSFADLKLL